MRAFGAPVNWGSAPGGSFGVLASSISGEPAGSGATCGSFALSPISGRSVRCMIAGGGEVSVAGAVRQCGEFLPASVYPRAWGHYISRLFSRSALRLLRRRLVHQLRPLAFHDRAHFVRDGVHALDLEHVLMQALQVRRRVVGSFE